MQSIDTNEPLTRREKEVLWYIAQGHSNTVIGEYMKISPRTVDTHRTNIRRKLQVNGIAGMVRYAVENHII